MSDVVDPVGTTASPAPPATGLLTRRRFIGLTVAGLVVASLGYAVGVRSPWTAHHPRALVGTAENVPSQPPSGLFVGEDGTRVWFRLDDVVWRTSRTSDDPGTIPPCLRREGREVAVAATVIEVTRPFGTGSYDTLLSLTCPSR